MHPLKSIQVHLYILLTPVFVPNELLGEAVHVEDQHLVCEVPQDPDHHINVQDTIEIPIPLFHFIIIDALFQFFCIFNS